MKPPLPPSLWVGSSGGFGRSPFISASSSLSHNHKLVSTRPTIVTSSWRKRGKGPMRHEREGGERAGERERKSESLSRPQKRPKGVVRGEGREARERERMREGLLGFGEGKSSTFNEGFLDLTGNSGFHYLFPYYIQELRLKQMLFEDIERLFPTKSRF